MKKIKPSKLFEKAWNEDLEKRGVFDNHCTGCTEKSWDLPEGRTHQMGTVEHPDKTNTLDKREKYRHDFIYHEVNGIIDQRLCRKCNLNEKLPEKNWNNEPCGNKLCENCHPEIYSKVKPEGVGEWEKEFDMKLNAVVSYAIGGECGGVDVNYCKKELKSFISNLILQEKAKWKGEIMTLINWEIEIAHTKNKGGKTSRLTSLAMAVSKLLT